MLGVLEELLARLDRGEALALCILARARGSTPQASGALMIVLQNGQSLGTLGGGCVEAEVVTRALRALNTTIPQATTAPLKLATFRLDHDFGWDDGLLCGGMMDVTIQVFRTPAEASAIRDARDALRDKTTVNYTLRAMDENGVEQSFEVPLSPQPTLLIAGAGHIGQAIAHIAGLAGFAVSVFDDRTDLLTPARFANARCVAGDVAGALRRAAIDPHTFIVIVTRGHRNDAAALHAVVNSPAAYVGMIGSKRKVRTILESLEHAGVPRDRLLRVHAPIGLEIGAIEPAEIAVSVCAELIAIRRGIDAAAVKSLKIDPAELIRWLDRDALK